MSRSSTSWMARTFSHILSGRTPKRQLWWSLSRYCIPVHYANQVPSKPNKPFTSRHHLHMQEAVIRRTPIQDQHMPINLGILEHTSMSLSRNLSWGQYKTSDSIHPCCCNNTKVFSMPQKFARSYASNILFPNCWLCTVISGAAGNGPLPSEWGLPRYIRIPMSLSHPIVISNCL